MFAVIKAGGKQYRVAAEDVIRIDRVKSEPGEIVEFGEVLLLGGDTPAARHADHLRGDGCRRGASAHPRRQGDRLQEAPAQEFAPQARLPPRVLGDPHHRDPDRRGQAVENGAAPRPKREPKPKAEGQVEGQAEAKPAKSKAKKPAAKKAGQNGQKKPATKGKKK